MHFHPLHPWNLAYPDAVAVQQRLLRRLRTDRPLDFSKIRTVAGADVAYEPRRSPRPDSPPAARFAAAVVVCSYPKLETLEIATAEADTTFPYLPGLLTFREGPALEAAFRKLRRRPDVVLFDGQGIAHPRGLGLAAHLGLLLGCPTVGCAKSPLYGQPRGQLGRRRGSHRPLLAPDQPAPASPFRPGQRIGTLLRTRDGVKPVWVSCGHMVNLCSAERLVLATTRGRRLPEPIRAAHLAANNLLRQSRNCSD